MFSVVIPAYNCAETICQVLDSVRTQTRWDLIEEIILINDGSTDDTRAQIEKYISMHPEMPILYVEQENKGASVARNRAIRMAKAEWIALLDADDLWVSHKIEIQYRLLQENDQIVFLGAYVPLKFWWKKHTGLYKLNAKELCVRNMPTTPSVVFRKDVGIAHGLFNENMHFCEDINFFQKFLLNDSYYVLAEKLVEVSYAKQYFAQRGLSSELYKMHKGRNRNVRELYRMGLISGTYMYVMLAVNGLKFARRYLQQQIKNIVIGRK